MISRLGNLFGFGTVAPTSHKPQVRPVQTKNQNQVNQLFGQMQQEVADKVEQKMPLIDKNGRRIARNKDEEIEIRLNRLRGTTTTTKKDVNTRLGELRKFQQGLNVQNGIKQNPQKVAQLNKIRNYQKANEVNKQKELQNKLNNIRKMQAILNKNK